MMLEDYLRNTDYRGADKSLAKLGCKQANISVRIASISFGALSRRKKYHDHSSLLDAVELARIPDMLPSLLPSWSNFPLFFFRKIYFHLGCLGLVGYNINTFQRMWTEVIVAYWKFNPIIILNRLTLK